MEEKYIDKIISLYSLSTAETHKVRAGHDQIASSFQEYEWADVERAIDYFYTNKSDKSRPRLAQLRAILNEWNRDGKVTKTVSPTEDTPITERPKTKIFTIADTFTRMMQIMEDCGVFLYPDSPRPNSTLIDSENNPILCPRTWLRAQLESAIQHNPSIFARFPYASFYEQLALALQNKLIRIKVRNWGEYKRNLRNPLPNVHVLLDRIG